MTVLMMPPMILIIISIIIAFTMILLPLERPMNVAALAFRCCMRACVSRTGIHRIPFVWDFRFQFCYCWCRLWTLNCSTHLNTLPAFFFVVDKRKSLFRDEFYQIDLIITSWWVCCWWHYIGSNGTLKCRCYSRQLITNQFIFYSYFNLIFVSIAFFSVPRNSLLIDFLCAEREGRAENRVTKLRIVFSAKRYSFFIVKFSVNNRLFGLQMRTSSVSLRSIIFSALSSFIVGNSNYSAYVNSSPLSVTDGTLHFSCLLFVFVFQQSIVH